MKAHWSEATFVVTVTSPAYDGSDTVNRYGYCRECKADMQSFGKNGKPGPVNHHGSHKRARQLGLTWERKVYT